MKKPTIIAIFLLGLYRIGFGQDPSIFPSPGSITWCPGEVNIYEVRTTGAQQTSCVYKWEVTNGVIQGGDNTKGIVSVVWNDTPGTGTLKITLTNCKDATNTSFSENYVIRSLAGRTPANARANQTLPYCSTATVQLAVDVMFMDNTGGSTGVPQQRADGYEWVLPSGWSSGGSTGTVTTSTEFISIISDNGCRGGSVSVRAFKNCTSKKYSSSATISVGRVGFSANLGIPSGYSGPKCGNQTGVTFTAANLSCASSYRWTATNTGWKDGNGALGPWTTATNTLTLFPSGSPTDDGIISVDINIGCATLTQTYRAIYTDPKLQLPQFNIFHNQFLLCSNTSASVSVNAVSGAVSYTWYSISEHPSYTVLLNGVNATQNSPITTTGTQITVQAPTLATGQRFGYDIFLKANRAPGCQGSLLSQLNGWVGPPLQAHYSQIYISGFHGENPITLAKGALYQFNIEPVDGATSYNWVLPPGFSFMNNQNTPYETVHVWTGNESGIFDIRCYPQGLCGTIGTGYSSIYVNLPGSGGGPGTPGCEEPPCIVPQPLSVFPNPVKGQLNISLAESNNLTAREETEIILLNKFQQKIYFTKTTNSEIVIPTNNLPNDLYYLMIRTKKESTTRQVVIKN